MENQFRFRHLFQHKLFVNVGYEFDGQFKVVRIGETEFVAGFNGCRIRFRSDQIIDGMVQYLQDINFGFRLQCRNSLTSINSSLLSIFRMKSCIS